MITTNDLEKLIYKLKDLDRRMPEFNLSEEIKMFQSLLDEVNKQPTQAVQIAIIKSPKVIEEL